MYNGENHMVIGNEAYFSNPDTIRVTVSISIITDIVNIGRWAKYRKADVDRDIGDAYIGFVTDIEVDCASDEDWGDDMGRIAVADQYDLKEQVAMAVREIDPQADYEIV